MTKTGFFKKVRNAKKGGESVEASLVEIGDLLKSIAMVIIFALILFGIYQLIKKQGEQGPQESYYQLMTKVKALDEGRFPGGIEQAYYIKDGYYLFGFNLDPDAIIVSKPGFLKSTDIEVKKPQKGSHGSSDECRGVEACICLCSNLNCDGSVTCNTELVSGKTIRIDFHNINYIIVTGDPKNKLTKGKDIDNLFMPSGYRQGKYMAIFGSDWTEGRIIKLKRTGNVVEVTFP